jgi:hypothetical protein
MPKTRVFLSYRRIDAAHQIGRIFDHLEKVYGRSDVFKDVDSIPAGADFRRVLEESVSGCDVMLVVIGDRWLKVADGDGKRRLANPDDFVRIEVEAALSRGMPVIPVLVGSAPLPTEAQLSSKMRPLAHRTAVHLRPDPNFRKDIQKLVDGIDAAAEFAPRALERLRSGTVWAKRAAAFFASIFTASVVAAIVFASRLPPAQKGLPDEPRSAEFEAVALAVPKISPEEQFEFMYKVTVSSAETRQGMRNVKRAVPIEKKDDAGKVTASFTYVTEQVPYTYTVMVPKQRDMVGFVSGDVKLRAYMTRSADLPFLLVVSTADSGQASVYALPTKPNPSEWKITPR